MVYSWLLSSIAIGVALIYYLCRARVLTDFEFIMLAVIFIMILYYLQFHNVELFTEQKYDKIKHAVHSFIVEAKEWLKKIKFKDRTQAIWDKTKNMHSRFMQKVVNRN
jgi:hypothetical protein